MRDDYRTRWNITQLQEDTIIDRIKTVCHFNQHNLALLKQHKWLSERTLILRYEDYLADREATTAKLLSFAKLTKYKKGVVPSPVPLADTDDAGLNKLTPSLERQFETRRKEDYDGFSWIKTLTKRQIERVEAHCADTMRLLGYRTYKAEHESNDTFVSAFV